MLVFAAITDKLVDFATNVVGDLGLAGVFALMVPESACIPIPSEATMLFAGFNVSKGHYSLFAATLVGAGANVVGSWIAYASATTAARACSSATGASCTSRRATSSAPTAGSS